MQVLPHCIWTSRCAVLAPLSSVRCRSSTTEGRDGGPAAVCADRCGRHLARSRSAGCLHVFEGVKAPVGKLAFQLKSGRNLRVSKGIGFRNWAPGEKKGKPGGKKRTPSKRKLLFYPGLADATRRKCRGGLRTRIGGDTTRKGGDRKRISEEKARR